MAPGDRDVQRAGAEPPSRPEGQVTTVSGRVSAAREVRRRPRSLPLSSGQLRKVDEILTRADLNTGLRFSVYLGDLGEDTHARARQLHGALGNGAAPYPAEAVLLAVSPGQRVVEVVTGSAARRRLSDRACRLAVMSMVSSFQEGDLAGGLLTGLGMLADEAGSG